MYSRRQVGPQHDAEASSRKGVQIRQIEAVEQPLTQAGSPVGQPPANFALRPFLQWRLGPAFFPARDARLFQIEFALYASA